MREVSTYTGRMRRYLGRGLFACILVAMTLQFTQCSGPPLQPWHTARLTAEFTAENSDEIKTFDDYRRLEDRLFAQVEEQVYAHTGTGPEYELVRYSTGSAVNRQHRGFDWNRSFELSSDSPVGGVLLLHGMSDSPYSLRALGEALNQRNFLVLGLRLPGHGTAPAGLKNVTWEDMAAAVRLSIAHLASKVGNKPIHIVGYSTGAPLALNFVLDALEGRTAPVPASLVLISPAIGIHPLAVLAGLKDRLSGVPGLGRLAWLSIEPEFDPYKYNSFTTNAGNQVHRLTRSVARRIASWARSGQLDLFPATLVFKSTVDATVSPDAVVESLLRHLGPHGHELVLFDINRFASKTTLLVSDPAPLTDRLMDDQALPFALTLVTNESAESTRVITRRKMKFSNQTSQSDPLNLAWPTGVISLSHVALPFPPDDPLYGQRAPDNEDVFFLGQMAIKGERGLFKIPYDWLLRLRHNPFYNFLESRTVEWIHNANDR